MDIEQITYLRSNTVELINDIPLCNWLIKLDNNYLKNIADNLELHTIKQREQYFFINFLLKQSYE